MILDDVIRRSRLEVLDGGLVSQPSRYDDDRRVRRELLRDGDRVPRRESRQRMVGQDDVGGEISQRCDHALARVDPQECARDVGAPDLALRELGVLWIVLDHEDPSRRGHGLRDLGGAASKPAEVCFFHNRRTAVSGHVGDCPEAV